MEIVELAVEAGGLGAQRRGQARLEPGGDDGGALGAERGIAEARAEIGRRRRLVVEPAGGDDGEAAMRLPTQLEARIGRPVEAREADHRRAGERRDEVVALQEQRVDAQPRRQRHRAEPHVDADEGSDVELMDAIGGGGDVVARRLAEDGDVALARRDGERAEAVHIRVGVEEVETGAEGDDAGDAAAVGGAQAGQRRAHVEVRRLEAVAIDGAAGVVAEERRDLDGGAVAIELVAQKEAIARAVEFVGVGGGGIAAGDLAAQRVVGGEEGQREPLAAAERERRAQLVVVPARQRNERGGVALYDGGGGAIEPRIAAGDGDGEAAARVGQERAAVEEVGADLAVEAAVGRRRAVDADEAAERAPPLGAEAARRQRDARDQAGGDRRAPAADMEQRRQLDAVEDDAGVGGRRAPHDDVAGADGGASDAGEILDDLEWIVGGAGDAARLLARDAGLDDAGALDAWGAHGRFVAAARSGDIDEIARPRGGGRGRSPRRPTAARRRGRRSTACARRRERR